MKMKFIVVCQFISVFGLVFSQEECDLINEPVTDACQYPLLTVTSTAEIEPVTCNSLVPKADFKDQPAVSFENVVEDELYTITMTDPDAPNSGSTGAWLHWIASNIKGSDIKSGAIDNGDTITPYNGPAPPSGSGIHRYQLLLFRQGGDLVTGTISTRAKFQLLEFASNNNLCGPLAGFQFRAQY